MKKIFTGIVLLVIIFSGTVLCGCPGAMREDPKSQTGQVDKDYFPMTKGSIWEYAGEGNEFAAFTREVLFAKGNRAQFTEDNGGTVAASVYEVTDDAVTRIFFQGEEYERTKSFIDTVKKENVIILKTPLKVGTKWNDDRGEREIVAMDATVETPLGKMTNCIKTKSANQTGTIYEYYKKGVGLVRRDFISAEDTSTTVSSILKRYDIKK